MTRFKAGLEQTKGYCYPKRLLALVTKMSIYITRSKRECGWRIDWARSNVARLIRIRARNGNDERFSNYWFFNTPDAGW